MQEYLVLALGFAITLAVLYYPCKFLSWINKEKFTFKIYFCRMCIAIVTIALLTKWGWIS